LKYVQLSDWLARKADIPMNLEHLYSVNDEGIVLPIIPYEEGDDLIHTDEHPQCTDPTCPCQPEEEEEEL
jgi:hypothetical protein